MLWIPELVSLFMLALSSLVLILVNARADQHYQYLAVVAVC